MIDEASELPVQAALHGPDRGRVTQPSFASYSVSMSITKQDSAARADALADDHDQHRIRAVVFVQVASAASFAESHLVNPFDPVCFAVQGIKPFCHSTRRLVRRPHHSMFPPLSESAFEP